MYRNCFNISIAFIYSIFIREVELGFLQFPYYISLIS